MRYWVKVTVTALDTGGQSKSFGLGAEMAGHMDRLDPKKVNAQLLEWLMGSAISKLKELRCPIEPWEAT